MTDLTAREIDELFADGTISGGMLPKIEGALDAAKSGVNAVASSTAGSARDAAGNPDRQGLWNRDPLALGGPAWLFECLLNL